MKTPRSTSHPVAMAGFTLIELLTVIAIIGVLAAIIIPTVSKVRKTAQTTRCTASLRSLATAISLFSNDNRGRFPVANSAFTATDPADSSTRFGHWYIQIAPYIGAKYPDGANETTRARTIIGRPVGCPRAPKYEASTDVQGIGASYGWTNVPYTNNVPQLASGIEIGRIPTLSRTIMLGERLGQNSGGSRDTGWAVNPPWITTPVDSDAIPSGSYESAVRLSHGGRSNYAFFDGHVALHRPSDTYTGDGLSASDPNMWKGF